MADERITVSRDALRADLAEMELRLRIFLEDRLNHKADQIDVTELALKLDKFEQGEFTVAQTRSIEEVINGRMSSKDDKSWTNRERIMGVVSLLTAISMLIISVAFSFHGVI